MSKANPNKPTFEDYFEWYLQELKDKGFILSYKKEKDITPFDFNNEVYIPRIKEFRKSGKPIYSNLKLVGKHTYKPDFLIYWAKKAKDIFYELIDKDKPLVYNAFFLAQEKDGDTFTFVDVKPPAIAAKFSGSFNSYATFPLNQSIIFEKHGIYTMKLVPIPVSGSGNAIALFPNTFTPNRFLFTDGGSSVRNIKFKIRTINDFLFIRNEYINKSNFYLMKLI
jgi:hypothetical protein